MRGTFGSDVLPVQITTGTRDLLLSQRVRLEGALRRAGVRVDLRGW